MQIIVQIMMAEKKSLASKLQLYKLNVPSNPANVSQDPSVTKKVERRKVFTKYCKLFIRIIFITFLYRNNANSGYKKPVRGKPAKTPEILSIAGILFHKPENIFSMNQVQRLLQAVQTNVFVPRHRLP